MNQRGFTLVELTIALALLVVLAVLLTLTVQGFTRSASVDDTIGQMLAIRDAVHRLGVDCGGLPVWTHVTGDPGLAERPAWATTCWRGPYLSSWPTTTPLGGSYQYEAAANAAASVVVHSLPLSHAQSLAQEISRMPGGRAVGYGGASRGWLVQIVIGRQGQVRPGEGS